MRVSELVGAGLDYWVARAIGIPAKQLSIRGCAAHLEPPTNGLAFDPGIIQPSTDWAQGGPIIEREGIGFALFQRRLWRGCAWDDAVLKQRAFDYAGPTPLIAAMRAFVASKFGDEVPDATA